MRKVILFIKKRFNAVVKAFIIRVEADGGTVEAIDCLNDNLSETASLQIIPSAYKPEVCYAILPEDGTGDGTVNRDSEAYRTNEQGLLEAMPADVIRVDYADGGCPVILTEDESTNLVVSSQDFSVGWVVVNGTISVDDTLSPEGVLNADKITEDSTSSEHYTWNNIGVTSGLDYTYTVFCKIGERSELRIFLGTSGFGAMRAIYNLDTDVITNESGTSIKDITDYGNGWKRLRMTVTATATTSPEFRLQLVNEGSTSYQGDGTSGIYIWGAQLEQLSYPTSYIKTEGSTVTRLKDEVTVIPPVGTTEIIETIDGVEQPPITVIPPIYTMPFGRINEIIMNS